VVRATAAVESASSAMKAATATVTATALGESGMRRPTEHDKQNCQAKNSLKNGPIHLPPP